METRDRAALLALAAGGATAAFIVSRPRAAAAPPPPPSTSPIRVAFVVPRDYPAYMDWQAAALVVRDRWLPHIQAWYRQQAALDFRVEFRWLMSGHTIYELATDPATGVLTQLDGCALAPIPQGQGAHATAVGDLVLTGELGWGGTAPARIWVVLIGAGGWAGGFSPDEHNRSWAMIGDWGLRYAVTGQPDPCAVRILGLGAATAPPDRALGHEGLHTMAGVDPHNPYVMTGDPLSPAQVAALRGPLNAAFLFGTTG